MNTIIGFLFLIFRIIEPSYSKVQVAYVAGEIGLPLAEVEKNLSEMILDKNRDLRHLHVRVKVWN